MTKRALITGITGQDGAYLAELLLAKDYEVHGLKRRASSFNTDRIDHLYQDPHDSEPKLILHHGDMTDSTNLIRVVQEVQPDDYVIATGQQHSVREFIELAARSLGIRIGWEGNGVDEVGRVIENANHQGPPAGDIIVRIDGSYFRPTEVGVLPGDATKAKIDLGWEPKTSFSDLVEEMIKEDLQMAQRDITMINEGYQAFNHHE